MGACCSEPDVDPVEQAGVDGAQEAAGLLPGVDGAEEAPGQPSVAVGVLDEHDLSHTHTCFPLFIAGYLYLTLNPSDIDTFSSRVTCKARC